MFQCANTGSSMVNWRTLVLCAFLFGFDPGPAIGAVVFYTDESTWLSAVGAPGQDFAMTATNVALADEVGSPPPPNSLLGQSLFFQAANTLLPFDFGFVNSSPDAGTEVIFTTDALGVTPTHHHDWSVEFGAPAAPFSIGLEIQSGGSSLIDAITVFDNAGDPLGSLTTLGSPTGATFIGIISDDPIGRVLYDDNAAPGGKVLTRLVIVPEMSCIGLTWLAIGVVGIAFRVPRQNAWFSPE